jgi:hypothetical protein
MSTVQVRRIGVMTAALALAGAGAVLGAIPAGLLQLQTARWVKIC